MKNQPPAVHCLLYQLLPAYSCLPLLLLHCIIWVERAMDFPSFADGSRPPAVLQPVRSIHNLTNANPDLLVCGMVVNCGMWPAIILSDVQNAMLKESPGANGVPIEYLYDISLAASKLNPLSITKPKSVVGRHAQLDGLEAVVGKKRASKEGLLKFNETYTEPIFRAGWALGVKLRQRHSRNVQLAALLRALPCAHSNSSSRQFDGIAFSSSHGVPVGGAPPRCAPVGLPLGVVSSALGAALANSLPLDGSQRCNGEDAPTAPTHGSATTMSGGSAFPGPLRNASQPASPVVYAAPQPTLSALATQQAGAAHSAAATHIASHRLSARDVLTLNATLGGLVYPIFQLGGTILQAGQLVLVDRSALVYEPERGGALPPPSQYDTAIALIVDFVVPPIPLAHRKVGSGRGGSSSDYSSGGATIRSGHQHAPFLHAPEGFAFAAVGASFSSSSSSSSPSSTTSPAAAPLPYFLPAAVFASDPVMDGLPASVRAALDEAPGVLKHPRREDALRYAVGCCCAGGVVARIVEVSISDPREEAAVRGAAKRLWGYARGAGAALPQQGAATVAVPVTAAGTGGEGSALGGACAFVEVPAAPALFTLAESLPAVAALSVTSSTSSSSASAAASSAAAAPPPSPVVLPPRIAVIPWRYAAVRGSSILAAVPVTKAAVVYVEQARLDHIIGTATLTLERAGAMAEGPQIPGGGGGGGLGASTAAAAAAFPASRETATKLTGQQLRSAVRDGHVRLYRQLYGSNAGCAMINAAALARELGENGGEEELDEELEFGNEDDGGDDESSYDFGEDGGGTARLQSPAGLAAATNALSELEGLSSPSLDDIWIISGKHIVSQQLLQCRQRLASLQQQQQQPSSLNTTVLASNVSGSSSSSTAASSLVPPGTDMGGGGNGQGAEAGALNVNNNSGDKKRPLSLVLTANPSQARAMQDGASGWSTSASIVSGGNLEADSDPWSTSLGPNLKGGKRSKLMTGDSNSSSATIGSGGGNSSSSGAGHAVRLVSPSLAGLGPFANLSAASVHSTLSSKVGIDSVFSASSSVSALLTVEPANVAADFAAAVPSLQCAPDNEYQLVAPASGTSSSPSPSFSLDEEVSAATNSEALSIDISPNTGGSGGLISISNASSSLRITSTDPPGDAATSSAGIYSASGPAASNSTSTSCNDGVSAVREEENSLTTNAATTCSVAAEAAGDVEVELFGVPLAPVSLTPLYKQPTHQLQQLGPWTEPPAAPPLSAHTSHSSSPATTATASYYAPISSATTAASFSIAPAPAAPALPSQQLITDGTQPLLPLSLLPPLSVQSAPQQLLQQMRWQHEQQIHQLQTQQLQQLQQLQLQQLQGPQLQGPQLQGPQLQGPQLQGPQLQGPQLQGPQMYRPAQYNHNHNHPEQQAQLQHWMLAQQLQHQQWALTQTRMQQHPQQLLQMPLQFPYQQPQLQQQLQQSLQQQHPQQQHPQQLLQQLLQMPLQFPYQQPQLQQQLQQSLQQLQQQQQLLQMPVLPMPMYLPQLQQPQLPQQQQQQQPQQQPIWQNQPPSMGMNILQQPQQYFQQPAPPQQPSFAPPSLPPPQQ